MQESEWLKPMDFEHYLLFFIFLMSFLNFMMMVVISRNVRSIVKQLKAEVEDKKTVGTPKS